MTTEEKLENLTKAVQIIIRCLEGACDHGENMYWEIHELKKILNEVKK